MQAIILAAGMGRRLGKYTKNMTKCMVEVGGKPILEHTVDALKYASVEKLVIVVGYESKRLAEYIETHISGLDVHFVYNDNYDTTNNIYSLYLAKEYLETDDTILIESDLVFDKTLIKSVCDDKDKNVVAVAKFEEWMDGTLTTLDDNGYIKDFVEKKDFNFVETESFYKTVNIYKFSKEFSKNIYIPFLEAYIRAYGNNQYYELVLKAIAHLSHTNLKAYVLQNEPWYEIDNAHDLSIANTIFSEKSDKLRILEKSYGGHWRYNGLLDFCYLVNPYFPPQKLKNHLNYYLTTLLSNYPSGLNTQKLLAANFFDVDESFVLTGNGAAELINALGLILRGKLTITTPTFNEYIRCFKNCDITRIQSLEDGFCFNKSKLISACKESDILVIVNPDNPSGSFLIKDDIIEILNCCKENNTICIIDESFIDFADSELRYTLFDNHILTTFPNLILVKSISKSYGVPGLRLGILASSSPQLIYDLQNILPVWNINSFAEYFLQIYDLYSANYLKSCDKISIQRNVFIEKLSEFKFLKVFPSQANYIMCEIINRYSSSELAQEFVDRYNILIKDLSTKEGFENRNFIRIAVKDRVENEYFLSCLSDLSNVSYFKA